MNEDDQLKYLANVIFAAGLNAPISLKQEAAVEEIRKTLGAKKNTFNLAKKHAQSGAYIPSPVGEFAVQAANLTDIVYISIVDGTLTDEEKCLVAMFSTAVDLTDDQLRRISKDALARARGNSVPISCPSCKAEIKDTAKFCPQCGTAIEAASAYSDFAIPTTGYSIEFCESTAARFDEALSVARQSPVFESALRNKKTWYLAAWPDESIEQAVSLAELLSGVRNRKCYFDGVEQPWDELFGFVWCAGERNSAYRPIEYCFGKESNRLNPWGCLQAGFEWTDWARWFSYGRFERAGIFKGKTHIWIFDKQRIEHELATNLHRVRFCPHLRKKLAQAVLAALPDSVEVTDQGPWSYSRAYSEVPGSIKVVERQGSGEFLYEHEYYADGVRPRGLSELRQILKKAFANAGVNDIAAEDLTR